LKICGCFVNKIKFRFFESGGLGRVPNEFSEPFSLTISTWKNEKKDDEMIFVEEHNVQEAFEMRKKKN
jgi:hypothetical protein